MIISVTIFQANILLDANFHCQIADFGLARHSDITVTRSTTALSFNFSAPELFGACSICNQSDEDGECPGCGKNGTQRPMKTPETDVYGFGCLYYEVSADFCLNPYLLGPEHLTSSCVDSFRPYAFQRIWRGSDNQVCHNWKASTSITRATIDGRRLEFNRSLLGDGSKESPDNGRHLEGDKDVQSSKHLRFRTQAGHNSRPNCDVRFRGMSPRVSGNCFVTIAYDNGNDLATFAASRLFKTSSAFSTLFET